MVDGVNGVFGPIAQLAVMAELKRDPVSVIVLNQNLAVMIVHSMDLRITKPKPVMKVLVHVSKNPFWVKVVHAII